MNEAKLVSLCLQTPGCLPVLCWGDFGIGKTSVISQIGSLLAMDTEILRPAERGEGALGVVPVPSEDREVLNYPLPDWAARLAGQAKDGLIFLDEVSSCPPALQPAIMGLALDGIIAGKRLPERIKRVAAANHVDQAAGGWELAPALANRFVHLTWASPSASDWTHWLVNKGGGVEIVRLEREAWDHEWVQAKALGAAFIRSHPVCLHEDVSKVLGRTPPAYATPRTWEAALRLLASCRAAHCMDLYPVLAQGCLGDAVALQGTSKDSGGAWLVWLRDNDLPDPEMLLKDPALFKHDPKRPDRTFATLLAVAEAGMAEVNGKKLTTIQRVERWEKAWEVVYIALKAKLGKDNILIPSQILSDRERRPAGKVGKHGVAVCQEMTGFIELAELIEAKG